MKRETLPNGLGTISFTQEEFDDLKLPETQISYEPIRAGVGSPIRTKGGNK